MYNDLRVARKLPFQVFGMPCNQFASQEPDANQDILAHVQKTYNVTFPMFAKLTVNAPCAETDPNMCSRTSKICCTPSNPVYAYLKSVFPGTVGWNYEKFLLGKDGVPVKRYISIAEPNSILPDIRKLLGI
jgi:glutathione peroxidase